MWTDPIIEETRRAREQYTIRFNYDLEAICRDLKNQERQSGRDVVSLLPKPPMRMTETGDTFETAPAMRS